MHTTDSKYSPYRAFMKKFLKQRLAVAAGIVVLCIVIVGMLGQWITPYDPSRPVTDQYAEKGISLDKISQQKIGFVGITGGNKEIQANALPQFEASSSESGIVKVKVTDHEVMAISLSKGSSQIVLSSGDAAALVEVSVSQSERYPEVSRLLTNKLSKSIEVGDDFQIKVSALLTTGDTLEDEGAIRAFIQTHSKGAKDTEQSDNGFVSAATEKTDGSLQMKSLTPAIIKVTDNGTVKAIGKGLGVVKVSAGKVSTVVQIPVNTKFDESMITDISPEFSYLELQDVYKHQPPSTRHWMGTDHANRDILSRIIDGTQYTMTIGFLSVFIGAFIGIIFGLLSGYYGRWVDMLITRSSDILLSFPGILLAIFVIAVLGPGVTNVIFAVAMFTVPIFIRIVRGSVLSLKEMTYVEAARSIGVRDSVIIMRHIFPGTFSVVLIYLTMRVGSAILIGAGLSYLGLGTDITAPEWGAMLNAAKNNSRGLFFPIFFPGLAIVITVLCFNILGDGLRDALDPKLRD